MSSARAIATERLWPPQPSTRVNSQTRPSETAKVERSWPTLTTTCAPVGVARVGARRRRERAQHRERLEVDARELDACLLAGEHVAVDELAVGDDEQHAPHGLPRLRVDVPPRARCQSSTASSSGIGNVSCARKRIAFASCSRIVDAGDLEGADADAVVGDAEPHALLRQLVLREELLERLRRAPSMSRSSPPTTTPSGKSARARPGGAAAFRSCWRRAPQRSATRRSSARRGRSCLALQPSASSAPSCPWPASRPWLPSSSSFQNGVFFPAAAPGRRILASFGVRAQLELPERRAFPSAPWAPSAPSRCFGSLGLPSASSRFQNGRLLLRRLLELLAAWTSWPSAPSAAFGSFGGLGSFEPRSSESSFFQNGAALRRSALAASALSRRRLGRRHDDGRRKSTGGQRRVPASGSTERRGGPETGGAARRSASPPAPRSDRSSRSASRSRRSPRQERGDGSLLGDRLLGGDGLDGTRRLDSCNDCASSAGVSPSFLRSENSFFQIESDTI